MNELSDVDEVFRRELSYVPSETRAARVRGRVLQSAQEPAAHVPWWKDRRPWMLAAALSAVFVAFWWWRSGSAKLPRGTSAAVVRASDGAQFDRQGRPGRETIILHDGVMRFEVPKLQADQFFRVRVGPDVVAVRGTAFHVVAFEGRLQSVAVAEGHVVVTLAESQPHDLFAGQVWSRSQQRQSAGDGPRSRRESMPASGSPGRSLSEELRQRTRSHASNRKRGTVLSPRPVARVAATTIPTSPKPTPDVASISVLDAEIADAQDTKDAPGERDFRDGWTGFERGNFAHAGFLLERSCQVGRLHNPVTEDACFWACVAYVRAGDRGSAQTRCVGFIKAWSNSLRVDEARVVWAQMVYQGGDYTHARALLHAASRSDNPSVRKAAARGLEMMEKQRQQ